METTMIWHIERLDKRSDSWKPVGYPIFSRDEAGKILESYQTDFPNVMYRLSQWERK